MQNITKQGRTIAIRLNGQLNDDLNRAAAREANSPSAVARRLITAGLQREARERARDEAQTSRQRSA